MQEMMREFLAWVDAAGPWAAVVYCSAVAATVTFLLPGFLLTLGAGFVFGPFYGTLLFMIGEMIGAMAAFAIARFFIGKRLRTYFNSHPRLEALEHAFSGEGWKFIALTRMVPFFPFKLSNYFFGSITVTFNDFFIGTLLGTIPLSFLMVYLGSVTGDLATLGSKNPWHSPVTAAISIGTALFAVAAMVWISKRAGRSYREKIATLRAT